MFMTDVSTVTWVKSPINSSNFKRDHFGIGAVSLIGASEVAEVNQTVAGKFSFNQMGRFVSAMFDIPGG